MKSAIHSIFKTFILSVLMIAQVHFAFAQTAAILPPAKTTFVDQNGKPLASGTVDFYIPGTTTRKTTWQDAAETIPNINPVVLDPSGRAIILGSGSYRQVVKDSLHNLIWDQVTASAGSGGSVTTATGDGDLVGTIKPWAGLAAPNQYLFTYGQEVSRVTYATLFTAITSSQAAFCSSGSAVLTGLGDTTNFWIGMTVELSCLAAGHSTVISKTATTVTMAANSNVTLNTTAVFFPWGDGNSTTTFNLPDFRGQVLTGNNNMGGTPSSNINTIFFGATDPNSIGAFGGSQKETLVLAELPTGITSANASQMITVYPAGSSANFAPITTGTITGSSAQGGGAVLVPSNNINWVSTSTAGFFANNAISVTSNNTGNSGVPTPIGHISPTKTTNYIIKVIPDTNSDTASGVTSLGGMTGDIACGTNLTCTGNIINANIPSSSSISFTGFEASSSRTVQSKLQDTFSVLDYATAGGGNCAPDATSDCSMAFNAAVAAALAYSQSTGPGTDNQGGKVYVPGGPNCYRLISAPINLLKGVNLIGDNAMYSCIYADNIDAVHIDGVNGFGQQTIRGINFQGINSTASRTGINRVGTTNQNDMLLGLTIEETIIYGFDTGIALKSVQNLIIDKAVIQNINQCMVFTGAVLNFTVRDTNCELAAGGGTGGSAFTGIAMIPYTYATGGPFSPEGGLIDKSQIFGFHIGVDIQRCAYCVITNSDLVATFYGLKLADPRDSMVITGNSFEMIGSSAVLGIYGVGQTGTTPNTTTVENNIFQGEQGTVSVGGIQVNSAGTSSNDNWSIRSNYFKNLNTYDIALYNPGGRTEVLGNFANSTGNTGSILIGTRNTGVVHVNNNIAATSITNTTSSDLTNGFLQMCGNMVNGSLQTCSWEITTDHTTANRLMIGGGGGVQPTALAAGTANTVVHGNAGGAPTMSAVVSADMNITATTCTNQFVSAISSGGVGTCGSVPIGTAVSGLGTGVAAQLALPTITTVAALPSCVTGTKSMRSFVTDNNTALSFAAVITTGGTIQTPVYCDGTVWRQG